MLTQSVAVALPRPNHLPLGPALTPVAQHRSAWQMARHVWQTAGALPFRRGFTPGLARAVVANGVSFAVFNNVMVLMDGKSASQDDADGDMY
jgi:negative regulator of sigma E activity